MHILHGESCMNNTSPRPFSWTPESISHFWNLLSETSLMRFSFGKVCGKAALQDFKKCIVTQETILDFGAGDGEITEMLLQQGYKVAIYEPSSGRNATIHKKNLEQYSNFIGYVTFEDEESVQDTFDVILLFEVLEHIHPLLFKETIEKIVAHLTPSGKIIGTVPDNENLEDAYCVCPQCGSLFHRWQHMRSFTEASLQQLLQEMKMRPLAITRASYAPSLFFMAAKTATPD